MDNQTILILVVGAVALLYFFTRKKKLTYIPLEGRIILNRAIPRQDKIHAPQILFADNIKDTLQEIERYPQGGKWKIKTKEYCVAVDSLAQGVDIDYGDVLAGFMGYGIIRINRTTFGKKVSWADIGLPRTLDQSVIIKQQKYRIDNLTADLMKLQQSIHQQEMVSANRQKQVDTQRKPIPVERLVDEDKK